MRSYFWVGVAFVVLGVFVVAFWTRCPNEHHRRFGAYVFLDRNRPTELGHVNGVVKCIAVIQPAISDQYPFIAPHPVKLLIRNIPSVMDVRAHPDRKGFLCGNETIGRIDLIEQSIGLKPFMRVVVMDRIIFPFKRLKACHDAFNYCRTTAKVFEVNNWSWDPYVATAWELKSLQHPIDFCTQFGALAET